MCHHILFGIFPMLHIQACNEPHGLKIVANDCSGYGDAHSYRDSIWVEGFLLCSLRTASSGCWAVIALVRLVCNLRKRRFPGNRHPRDAENAQE